MTFIDNFVTKQHPSPLFTEVTCVTVSPSKTPFDNGRRCLSVVIWPGGIFSNRRELYEEKKKPLTRRLASHLIKGKRGVISFQVLATVTLFFFHFFTLIFIYFFIGDVAEVKVSDLSCSCCDGWSDDEKK